MTVVLALACGTTMNELQGIVNFSCDVLILVIRNNTLDMHVTISIDYITKYVCVLVDVR